jgi:amidase
MTTQLLESAVTIAADVRAGRRSAVDVTRDHLARIDAFDPDLNAFQSVRAAGALADAAAVDAHPSRDRLPLAGVPVALKDNMAVVGEPVRHGSAATSDRPAHEDDLLVTRLRDAGAIVLGTTRMPELAAWAFTASTAYGVTRNPFDPALDPGGSSGGAAAAVAAGMVALAVGTDGGGSIRVPSAYCGLVGLKPTHGLVPLPGGHDRHWFGLTAAGPLARTAEDAAAALAVLSASPVVTTAPASLRVAVSLRSPSPLGRPDAQQRAAVGIAEARLTGLGHAVASADPRYPATLLNVWGRSWLAGIAAEVDHLGLDETRLEARTRAMVRRGRRHGPASADGWRHRAEEFFDTYDVLVTPVTARRPGQAGALNGKGYRATYLASARSVPFCQAWNLLGFPAVSVPVGFRDGLPLSVQLVARPGSDGLLLGLAATLS